MFAGKKKQPRKDHSGKNLAQYGLFDVPTDLNFDAGLGGVDDDDSDDGDLEAELMALASDSGPKRPPRKKPAVPVENLDNMVAESMRDIPSDEELSVDEDDPELLNELGDIAGEEVANVDESNPEPKLTEMAGDIVRLLEERQKMYELAEANAKAANETSRARRFNRGLNTIKDLLRQAKAGKTINKDDIPPEVSTGVRKPPVEERTEQPLVVIEPEDNGASVAVENPPIEPITEPQKPDSQSEPQPSTAEQPDSSVSEKIAKVVEFLTNRQQQYKTAALEAKHSGDKETAIKYIKTAKQFDPVIEAVKNGQPVDLSGMPGPPGSEKLQPAIEHSETQQQSNTEIVQPEENLITANSVEEALLQRLEVYKKQEEKAKEQNNPSKVRRMGRLVKQFEDALKQHRAGKPVAFDELPTPPGYAPIPVGGGSSAKPKEETTTQPTPSKTPQKTNEAPAKPTSTRISGSHTSNTRSDKQLALLLEKQKEFKIAALKAKQKGEIEQAKQFLKTAKGFDRLIEAAQSGLPVDLTTVPLSPAAKSQLDEGTEIVMAEECTERDQGDLDLITRLEMQLTKQLKMCLNTRDHHKALGDVAGMNRFEHLALSVTKDLDIVRLAHRTPGAGVPKFHYEYKDFSIVKSFTELGDNDLELFIARGINYNCANPKEVDTYVKFEFPYPQEEPYKDKTATVKNTNNPEYNATFTIPFQRSSRSCLRIFKRHSIKFEIYSKGGFFRGDTLLGTVAVKLQSLETQCELHDSFDLMDGRKKTGGKLEVRLRVRHPMLTQEVQQLHEKWLVLD